MDSDKACVIPLSKACSVVTPFRYFFIMKEKDWFRIKKYPHIGLPFENKDRQFVSSYVKDKNKIISHAFYPLIHRELSVRKFRRKRSDDGSRSSKRFIFKSSLG